MQVDNLILTKSLGKGSFGEVFLTTKQGTNEYYATKRLDRAFSEKPANVKRLTNEIKILKGINHPNIVRLIELKKTKTHVYIVTEYCNGGDLTSCLRKYVNKHFKPFPEEIVQYLMKQIVNAINFLHTHKVIHRDLKLDNILLNFPTEEDKKNLNMMKATVKLIDFGFATVLRSSKSNLTHTVLGTPTNMEPQLLQNMEEKKRNIEGYDEKADIWSLGTLCYELLEGRLTFSGRNMDELYKKVRDGKYTLPLNSSKEVISFINGMLQYDPNKRLSAAQLLQHDFLTKDVKTFHNIDRKKIENKIVGNEIKMNIKDNKTIIKALNQENDNQEIYNVNNNNKINNNNYMINKNNNKKVNNNMNNNVNNNNMVYFNNKMKKNKINNNNYNNNNAINFNNNMVNNNNNNIKNNNKNEIPQKHRHNPQQNNNIKYYYPVSDEHQQKQFALVTKINNQQIQKTNMQPKYHQNYYNNYNINIQQDMFPIQEVNQEQVQESYMTNQNEMEKFPHDNKKYYNQFENYNY